MNDAVQEKAERYTDAAGAMASAIFGDLVKTDPAQVIEVYRRMLDLMLNHFEAAPWIFTDEHRERLQMILSAPPQKPPSFMIADPDEVIKSDPPSIIWPDEL